MSKLLDYIIRAFLREHRLTAVPDRAGQLRLLLSIADRALALQPRTDDLIRACDHPGEQPGALAERGGSLVTEYAHLSQEANETFVASDLEPLRARLTRQLDQHQRMINESLQMAFSPAPAERPGDVHRPPSDAVRCRPNRGSPRGRRRRPPHPIRPTHLDHWSGRRKMKCRMVIQHTAQALPPGVLSPAGMELPVTAGPRGTWSADGSCQMRRGSNRGLRVRAALPAGGIGRRGCGR